MISADQLCDALVAAGVPRSVVDIEDEDFELVEPSWITGELARDWAAFIFNAGLAASDKLDCNRWAKGATWLADVCAAKDPEVQAPLAIGRISIAARMHRLVIAVHLASTEEVQSPQSKAQSPAAFCVKCYESMPSVPPGKRVFSPVVLFEVAVTREEYQSCTGCIFD